MFIVVEKFLKLNNFSSVTSNFEDYYQSHPNFPSLFALTDTFSSLNIENIAARVDKNQYNELPENFLGYVIASDKTVQLALVHKINDAVELTFEGEKPEHQSIQSFMDRWNGIVVAIEPAEAQQQKLQISFSFTLLFAAVALEGTFILFNSIYLNSWYMIMFSTYIIGGLLGVLIVREKFNNNPSASSKICSIGANTSCDSVIKSEQATLTKWVDFSDLGILFYGSAMVAMIIEPESFGLINALSLFAIPLIMYSLWVQRTILKTWCILCLGLSTVLLVQALFSLLLGISFSQGTTELLFSIVVIGFLWFLIRSLLQSNVAFLKSNTDLLRFKRDFDIYGFLRQSIPVTTDAISVGKIKIGASTNPVSVAIIISPSCGHCDEAIQQAFELYQENPNRIKLEVFYNMNPENHENPYVEIARTILQIAKSDQGKAIEALTDWHVKQVNRVKWKEKWGQEKIDPEIDNWMETHYKWCLDNEFNYTPVRVVNDSILSKHYTIKELRYFISELIEIEGINS